MTRQAGYWVGSILATWIVGAHTLGDMQKPKRVVPAQLGSTRNVHAYGSTLMCGQPSAEDFAEAKKRGFEIVISLRQSGEINWDEAATIRELGMEFHAVPFGSPATLSDRVFDKARKILKSAKHKPVLLHCGSANRVGAIWLAYRVLDHGLTVADAEKEAERIGLRTKAYGNKALDYIQYQQERSNNKRQ